MMCVLLIIRTDAVEAAATGRDTPVHLAGVEPARSRLVGITRPQERREDGR